MQESQSKIQKRIDYLCQVDILQFGSTINEPSHLYEINLKDDTEDYDYQPFTTTYFTTEPPTSYNEEPSRWLPKQDDSPRLETEDHNLSEFLKRVNEALETCEKAYNDYVMTEEKNAEQELFSKIHEILKPNYGKANKTRVDEPNSFLPHNDCTERVRRSNEFLQGYHDNINYVPITDDSIYENELESLIREYMSSEDMNEQTRAYGDGNGLYNSTCLEEQLTGASLEYWGDHSINSVEHSLIQSEWNILNPQSEFVSWLQH